MSRALRTSSLSRSLSLLYNLASRPNNEWPLAKSVKLRRFDWSNHCVPKIFLSVFLGEDHVLPNSIQFPVATVRGGRGSWLACRWAIRVTAVPPTR